MQDALTFDPQRTARWVGLSLLGTILIGILSAVLVVQGIDVNLTADVAATAENMMEAELRLRAKAYIALLVFALGAVVSFGLYLLLRRRGPLLAGWSLLTSFAAAGLGLMGAVYAMNAAELASTAAFGADSALPLSLAKLQAMSDYTSFHLSLVLSAAAMAGFFYLFLKSGLIPKIISAWGVFASLFVVIAIVARDFIPAAGHTAVTGAFMISNLIALVTLGAYLTIKGVRKIP